MTDLPEGVTCEFYGTNCPVQADGTVDGKPMYFRARGSKWTLGIGGDPVIEPEWFYSEGYPGGRFDAGWMTEDEATAFIIKAVTEYRAGTPSR